MDEQEFYDTLWNEFKDSDDNGTFTTWLVNKMGVINVYVERLRLELSQARASQGIPHEVHQAVQRDIQRLRDELENERQRNRGVIAPPIGQPRPTPPTIQPDRWVDNPAVPNTGGWAPGGVGPADWNVDERTTINWDRLRELRAFETGPQEWANATEEAATDRHQRRRLHEVGQQEEFERVRERLLAIQRPQDDDSGES